MDGNYLHDINHVVDGESHADSRIILVDTSANPRWVGTAIEMANSGRNHLLAQLRRIALCL